MGAPESLISKEKTGGKLPADMGLDSRLAKRIDSTQAKSIESMMILGRPENQTNVLSHHEGRTRVANQSRLVMRRKSIFEVLVFIGAKCSNATMNCGRFVLGKKGGEKECHGEREAARLAEVFCHSADSHKLIQIQPSQRVCRIAVF